MGNRIETMVDMNRSIQKTGMTIWDFNEIIAFLSSRTVIYVCIAFGCQFPVYFLQEAVITHKISFTLFVSSVQKSVN